MKLIKLSFLFFFACLLQACMQSGKAGGDGSLAADSAGLSSSAAAEAAGEEMLLKPGYLYMLKGEVQGWKKITGKLSVNSEMQVLFFYSDVNHPKLENSWYGYISGNEITIDTDDGEIKGTIADEITGTWKTSQSDKPFAFTLKITGCVVSDLSKMSVPPPPEAPVAVEEDTEDTESPTSEGTSEQVVEVKYVPVVVEESDDNVDTKTVSAEVEEDVNKVYDTVEVMPEYPGGTTAMMQFISRNLEYPKICQENGTQGKVVVKFTVGKDGSLSNVHAIRSVDSYLDKEAMRIISAMPRWKPGMQKGKPVNVSYVVPINFRLQ